MQRPNLFHFATSELSQDAFLAWLIKWANDALAQEDRVLHEAGRAFLARMLALHGEPPPNAVSLDVKRQHHAIDLFLRINDEIGVIIEDKVDTSEHSGQLQRYREQVARSDPGLRCLPIFVKLLEQSDYGTVTAAGYQVIRRADLLEVLRSARKAGSDHDVLLDFLDHLEEIERDVESYKVAGEWSGRAWQGFFVRLQDELDNAQWSYVPNQAGGFMGLWWYSRRLPNADNGDLYLQLEDHRLCYKISVAEKSERSARRHLWHRRLCQAGDRLAVEVVKPKRFGSGSTMTVAQLARDYRAFRADGTLDVAATVATLRRAQDVVEAALERD